MFEKIKEILIEEFDLDADTVTMNSSFSEDLGVDSLDLFELMLKLEEEYNFEVPGEELAKMKKISDVIEYLDSHNIKD